MMSSEESCTDDDDVYIKPIPWRADVFILTSTQELKTPQAQRQRATRKISAENSSRPIPEDLPTWAVKNYKCFFLTWTFDIDHLSHTHT